MQGIYDFLTFRSFISPYILFAFYYLGAVAVPLGSWLFTLWVRRRYGKVSEVYDAGKSAVIKGTRKKDRLVVIGVFVSMFVFMEILWRMMFEFLIAYLQMREALLGFVAA